VSDTDIVREFVDAGGYEVIWTLDEAEPELGKQASIVPRDKEPVLAALDRLESQLVRSHQEIIRADHVAAALARAEAAEAEIKKMLHDKDEDVAAIVARAEAAEAERDEARLTAVRCSNCAAAEAERDRLREALEQTNLRVGTVLMALSFLSEEHRSNFHKIVSSELIEAQDIARAALSGGSSE
jgi:hypothetical protein